MVPRLMGRGLRDRIPASALGHSPVVLKKREWEAVRTATIFLPPKSTRLPRSRGKELHKALGGHSRGFFLLRGYRRTGPTMAAGWEVEQRRRQSLISARASWAQIRSLSGPFNISIVLGRRLSYQSN